MIKKLLIALVILVVLTIAAVAVTAFLTPTDFRVHREVTINKPRAEIYSYVKFLKNQNEWGPWFKKEPTMEQHFRGTDGAVGFVSHWNGKSDEIGEGEQEIKALVENERMDTEVRFKRPVESTAQGTMTLEPASDTQTKVRWALSGSMPRPMNIFMLFMDMDKALGKDLDEGLASLKGIMEKN
jgi:uncharacterized membrane protein